ncbi:MAG: hypothetical protein RLY78_3623 [Pseudomonadota bacterium]|jgi:hypothetical protein
MITLDLALYLRVQELPDGPRPLPLRSGFSPDTAYRSLGLFNPSETSDAYFIFSNDRDEIWFICNRHLRTVGTISGASDLRIPLDEARRRVNAASLARPQDAPGFAAPAWAGVERAPGLVA